MRAAFGEPTVATDRAYGETSRERIEELHRELHGESHTRRPTLLTST